MTFLTHKPLSNINSNVESEFHARRRIIVSGKTRDGAHNGMDFSCYKSSVMAAHSGTIIRMGTSTTYGNYIIIRDDNTKKGTLYAHLDSFNSNLNRNSKEIKVLGGQEIGISGNSGGVPWHLHFEVLTTTAINRYSTIDYDADKVGMSSTEHHLRENPRPHLAQAFSSSFPTAVKTGNGGYDIEGDHRPNQFTLNARDNTVILGDDDSAYDPAGNDSYKMYGDANVIEDRKGNDNYDSRGDYAYIEDDNGKDYYKIQGRFATIKDKGGKDDTYKIYKPTTISDDGGANKFYFYTPDMVGTSVLDGGLKDSQIYINGRRLSGVMQLVVNKKDGLPEKGQWEISGANVRMTFTGEQKEGAVGDLWLYPANCGNFINRKKIA